ncbi:MAG TPA: ABC transporter permease subunit [Bdellovibrionota bacterium]|nr:ABC transporter permease subunit [Bdellovibrionota bacterium]
MGAYLVRRLLLLIPTLFGISLIVFVIINLAPGSPVEQALQNIRFGGGGGGSSATGSAVAGDQGVSQEVVQALKRQYGFDKPLHERYFIWVKNLVRFDFGESFTYQMPVIDLVLSKFPVSLQFGIISFLLTYLVCIPLGVMSAYKEDQSFDVITSVTLVVLYAIPPFMLGILLITFFSGGRFFDWFPIGGLYSDSYDYLSLGEKIWDRIYHFILPLTCYMIGSFTTLTLLTRNSVLDEIRKDYIRTARAKGLSEKAVYLRHCLRNALIPLATGIGSFLGVFFAGSLLIERIFQLDGIGLLSYSSVLSRDYNVIMGLTFIQSLALVVGKMISDFAYVLVDPRIDFQ